MTDKFITPDEFDDKLLGLYVTTSCVSDQRLRLDRIKHDLQYAYRAAYEAASKNTYSFNGVVVMDSDETRLHCVCTNTCSACATFWKNEGMNSIKRGLKQLQHADSLPVRKML